MREEQGNYPEALTHFRDAVKLDPDYLNAWKHIETVGEEYYLSAADQDAITFNTFRLDPLSRHGGWSGYRKVTDLRRLWVAVETADRFRPEPAVSLYPLPASKAALEKAAAEAGAQQAEFDMMSESYSFGRSRRPAQVISENELISKALQVLSGNRFGGGID